MHRNKIKELKNLFKMHCKPPQLAFLQKSNLPHQSSTPQSLKCAHNKKQRIATHGHTHTHTTTQKIRISAHTTKKNPRVFF